MIRARGPRLLPLTALALLSWVGPGERVARGARYAVLAANNQGWATEEHLQFAHADAARLAGTLMELGGFASDRVQVLRDATPSSIARALETAARQMRRGPRGVEHLLLFYYSGHANELGLHPGRDRLSYERLKALLAGVPAKIRVTLIDSCKSGALTRIKGRPGPSFDIRVRGGDPRISGDVFITSSSSGENAQESARLQGSFFTTNVTAGLRGAADANRDGKVTLTELYSYAHDTTVGRTSGTRGGTQHPSFRYDLTGRGEVVLTTPGRARACLVLGGELRGRVLVLRDADEAVLAEAAGGVKGTTRIGLPPGRYKVRQRRPRGVFEQREELLAGECRRVRQGRMKQIILPESLSKGELLAQTWSLGVLYGASIGNLTVEPALPIHQVALTLRAPIVQLRRGSVGLWGRLRYGSGSYQGTLLAVETQLLSAGLAVTWDYPTPWGLLGAGPAVHVLLAHQDLPPLEPRWVSGLELGGTISWSLPLPIWRLALELRANVGDAIYGLGGAALRHTFTAELCAGLLVWW